MRITSSADRYYLWAAKAWALNLCNNAAGRDALTFDNQYKYQESHLGSCPINTVRSLSSALRSGLKEKCVDSLVFETLIPKPMMQHYISLLLKHRRLILSGPSGTGKSYLASRLAEYLVDRSAREVTDGIVVTFNMHRQSCKVTEGGRLVCCGSPAGCSDPPSSPFLSIFPFFFLSTGSAALSFQPGQSNRSGKQHVGNTACRYSG